MRLAAAGVVCVLVCVLALVAAQATQPESAVLYNASTDTYQLCVECGHLANAAAWGTYLDQVNQTGWGELRVTTNAAMHNHIAMYAAGYLEGGLTQEQIWQFYQNYVSDEFGTKDVPAEILDYLSKNEEWLEAEVAARANTDPYWEHVKLLRHQFDGLVAGYQLVAIPSQNLTRLQLLLVNYIGDIDDLKAALVPSLRPHWFNMTAEEALAKTLAVSHCSALVKVTDDFSSLFAAHTTWGSYQTMLRIYKFYTFALGKTAAATTIAFSSYPGVLVSDDDYFQTDAGLVVMETTNDVYDETLYKHVQPVGSVLYWIRAIVATRMAHSGQEWMQIFSRYNSGTYNNQWIVVDYKLFRPNQPLPDHLLWIGEQYPGGFVANDLTATLRLGYWPSYNVPYFEEVYNAMGYPQMYRLYGAEYSYSLCPRGMIFRRDQESVNNMGALQKFMQYNDWQHDPLSGGEPSGAISARNDLKPSKPHLSGGIDTKATSDALVSPLSTWVICGPTKESQPVFTWDNWPGVIHAGQPTVFDFDWILLAP